MKKILILTYRKTHKKSFPRKSAAETTHSMLGEDESSDIIKQPVSAMPPQLFFPF